MGIVETIKELAREEGREEIRKEARKEARKELKAELISHNEKVVSNLLQELGLSDEQAASIAGVSVSFVKKTRLKLKTK